MNAEKLKVLIMEHSRNINAFSEEIGIPRSTIYTVLRSDDRVLNMSLDTFIKIAHGLDMTADELIEALKEDQ